ncbi:MAG: amidase [Solirubrobacteraceae bacterium]
MGGPGRVSGGSAHRRREQPGELALIGAVEALAAFRARRLSPVELLDAVIDRAQALEPSVNAFAETMFEQARALALESERRYAPGSALPPRPLEGLAVAAKEALPLRGHPVTEGLLSPLPDGAAAQPAGHGAASAAGRGARAASAERGRVRAGAIGGFAPAGETSWALQRVLDAGGIVHARTTTSELCCMPVSHARRWGVTRNPWDLSKSVGGSSGGSAAALAAGTATLATGSDLGGSIRAPACLAGVVGYKPPRGRVPLEPPASLDPWAHLGPLARTVEDAALLANAISGPHPGDPSSLPARAPIRIDRGRIGGLRIACCPRPGNLPVEEAVAANAVAAALALRESGARVEEVELALSLNEIKEAMWAHGDPARARAALSLERELPGSLSPYAIECFERALRTREEVSDERRRTLEERVCATLDRVFERFDALVLPTMGVLALDAGEDYVQRPLLVDRGALEHFCDAALTPMFNMAGERPVVAVPSGLAASDAGLPLPTGVQVVGAPGEEDTALSVAAAIEAARPFAQATAAIAGTSP